MGFLRERDKQIRTNTHASHICIVMFSSKHTYDTGLWPRTLLKPE